jgi:hypothetical protein
MKKGISQEGLKLIACLSMLVDHIGYELIAELYRAAQEPGTVQMLYRLYYLCRIVGRIAMPIYAFLLVEGAQKTRDPIKYGIRLLIGAVLAEVAFDLVVSGKVFGPKQSVMMTLFFGYAAVLAMKKCETITWKPVVVLPFALLAEVLDTDYGWMGVVLVALFDLSRYLEPANVFRFFGMVVLFHFTKGKVFYFGNISVPMQVFGALSMVFIGAYNGKKLTWNKGVQWAFYLFYPVHMLILWVIGQLMRSGILL